MEERFAVDIWVQAGGQSAIILPVNTFVFKVKAGTDLAIIDTYDKVLEYVKESGRYNDLKVESFECGFRIHGWVQEGDFKMARNFYVTNLRKL